MSDLLELKRSARARAAAGWKTMDGIPIPDLLALIAENERMREDACFRAVKSLRGDCRDLLVERNSLAYLLKRFVDGEHDQDENQAERHMYHDEAKNLLAYLGGELQGHTLVPDGALHAMKADNDTLVAAAQALRDEWRKCQADAGRYQFIADSACDVSFLVSITDYGDGDTTPGPRVELTPDQYPVEMFGTGKAKLDFAVDALMAKKEVATPSTDNENVSRHEVR